MFSSLSVYCDGHRRRLPSCPERHSVCCSERGERSIHSRLHWQWTVFRVSSRGRSCRSNFDHCQRQPIQHYCNYLLQNWNYYYDYNFFHIYHVLKQALIFSHKGKCKLKVLVVKVFNLIICFLKNVQLNVWVNTTLSN